MKDIILVGSFSYDIVILQIDIKVLTYRFYLRIKNLILLGCKMAEFRKLPLFLISY